MSRSHAGLKLVPVALALAAGASGAYAGGAAGGINITFTNNWNALPAAQRAIAQGCVIQAAVNWETCVPDLLNYPIDVSVDWGVPIAFGNQSSQDCGVGGMTQQQFVGAIAKPRMGSIILNSTLNNWFFDPTPAVHEEYDYTVGEPWRGTAKPTGPAAGKVDLLSCAKHEIGHVLGFFYNSAVGGLFQPWKTQVGLFGGIQLNDFGGIVMPVPNAGNDNDSSHFMGTGDVPGTAMRLTGPVPMAHLLMVPDAGPMGDERTTQSPWDISALAKVIGLPLGSPGYNLAGKGVIVPEPGAAAILLLGGLVGVRRRRS